MKKYFFSIALALTLLLINGVMAQKKDPRPLNGWIEYKAIAAGQTDPGKPTQKLSANPMKGAPISASQPRSTHNQYTLYATEKTMTFLGGDFYYRAEGAPFEATIGARFDMPYRTAVYPVCKLTDDCELFKKIQTAHDNGNTKELASLLEKCYIRLNEVRNIAGIECVGYKVLLKGAEGVIWVAEDIDLPHCMAPYIGIYHPIMEFDYCFPVKGLKPIHLVAAKVVNSDQAETMSRKCIPMEERVNPEELMDMIQHELPRFNR